MGKVKRILEYSVAEKKVGQMSKAWNKVINVSHVAWTRKSRKEAQLVCYSIWLFMYFIFFS